MDKSTFVCVIGVVCYKDQYLLLKRTAERKSQPNKWQPVSERIQENESIEKAVLRGVKEETGLEGKIKKTGRIFISDAPKEKWVNIPFLISVTKNKIKTYSKEHSDYLWLSDLKKLGEIDGVEGLKQDFESLELI